MSKKQKIKLVIAVICLVASVAIAILSIGGIVSAASASYDSGKAEGGLAILGGFAFVIAIMATMVVCTFALSVSAVLSLVALLLFKGMLPDANVGSRSALKALYGTSRVIFTAEAVGTLALITVFAVSAISG